MYNLPYDRNLLFCLACYLFLFNQPLSAQLFYTEEKINTDSLSEVLRRLTGQERIPILNKLASASLYSDAEKSLDYAREADSLLPESADPAFFFDTRLTLGLAWMSLGSYDKAILPLLDAYEASKTAGRLDWRYAAAKPVILSYLYTRNYDIAERQLDEFMQFDRANVPGDLLFGIMISAAWAHWNFLGNYEQALRLQQVCLAVSDTVAIRKPNLAVCYYQMGICEHNLQRYDSADMYFRKAEAICEEYQVSSLEHYRSYWVETLLKLGKYNEALQMIEELTVQTDARKHYLQVADDYLTWGGILVVLNRPDEAIGKFEKALEYGEWVKTNKALGLDSVYNINFWYTPEQNVKTYLDEVGIRIVSNAHFRLYEQYDRLKDTEKALYHLLKHEEEKNSLVKLEREKMVMELETRYQTQKKEQQIVSLAQQNQIKEEKLKLRGFMLAAVSGFLAVIVILAILLFRQNHLTSLHQALVLEQKLLRSQMNPHFVFNTLASIQTFILQEDPEKASRYMAKFSKLVRNILDNSAEEYVTLSQEISTVVNYLELQKLRYAGKFDYSVQVDEEIDTEEMLVPPMLCQPFIENALEHGIKHKNEPGRIDIDLFVKEKDLVIQITDDGVGRERSKEIESVQKGNHRSMSTNITTDRLKIINKKSGKKIHFKITDLRNSHGKATGTRVTLVFEG
ncbi:MAG TPA: histidine kinase [Bacteroidales bacterium]|nr:histidine kinase [Bacteroidales bacterium]